MMMKEKAMGDEERKDCGMSTSRLNHTRRKAGSNAD